MEPSSPLHTSNPIFHTAIISKMDLIEIISGINAEQIENISKTMIPGVIEQVENDNGKLFEYVSEYQSLAKLILPLFITELTEAFSLPTQFVEKGHIILLADSLGKGLLNGIENTILKRALERYPDEIFAIGLFQKQDKETKDLNLYAYLHYYGDIMPLKPILTLKKHD